MYYLYQGPPPHPQNAAYSLTLCLSPPARGNTLIAFGVAGQTIFHLNAKQNSPPLGKQLQNLPPLPRANMQCSWPTANSSVSVGLTPPPVTSAVPALTFTVAASVARQVTVLEVAKPRPDTRWVTTPLNPDRVEELLCKYGIVSNWSHIITGLQEGFDVRIHGDKSTHQIPSNGLLFSTFYHFPYTADPPTSTVPM